MLNPCSPCVCSNLTCEQCHFGYHSKDANQKQLVTLLCSYIRGDANPSQQRIAKSYIDKHPDFREELEKIQENKFTPLAKDVRELYAAFRVEGFTEEEAVELTKEYMGVAFKNEVMRMQAKEDIRHSIHDLKTRMSKLKAQQESTEKISESIGRMK